jgi:hypothetical protein
MDQKPSCRQVGSLTGKLGALLAFLTRFTHATTGKDKEPLVFTQNTEKNTSTTGNQLATQPLHPAEQCPFTSSIRNQGQLNFFSDNTFRSFSQSPGMLRLGPRKKPVWQTTFFHVSDHSHHFSKKSIFIAFRFSSSGMRPVRIPARIFASQ